MRLEPNKIGTIVTEINKEFKLELGTDEWANTRNLVNRARQWGLVPGNNSKALVPDDTYTWEAIHDDLQLDWTQESMNLAREVLSRSVAQAKSGVIDFDDQIYMSTMFQGLYPKFPMVLVDEAQDLSPLNHVQLKRVASDRLIVVGDPKQAIYAFRGASSSSMAKIKELKPDWVELPLTTTFRCPKQIVARQWDHAPDFTAAPSAPEGQVLDWRSNEVWEWGQVPTGSQAVICRNNAPIISLAFKLLRQRIGITVLGRDIGRSLATLVKKVCGEDSKLGIVPAMAKITEWKDKEIGLAQANNKPEKVPGILDRYESLEAIASSGECLTVGDMLAQITFLFEDCKGKVTLCTGHKSKGLEWESVIHLDPWRVPSKWAKTALEDGNPIPMEQETNLRYVIETRSKQSLVLANLEQFQ